MTAICRTPGCENHAADETTRFCAGCRRGYADRRALTAKVSAALYRQHPELFARLSQDDAHQLAEHLVAHASEGEQGFYARFWAGIDFIREIHERRAHGDASHRILTQRRHMRGAPHGATA